MTKLQRRTYSEIFERIIARTVVRSNLTDLSKGAATRHLISAVAREIDDAYFQLTRVSSSWSIRTASGRDLDERAKDIQPGFLSRRGASTASGSLIFSRGQNTGTTLVIPVGTTCKNSVGAQFVTTEEAIISGVSDEQIAGHGIGRDSNSVAAVSITAGTSGNTAANTITKFLSKPSGLSTVLNPEAFVGGEDIESDDSFRSRLLEYVNGLSRCTEIAARNALLGLADPTPNSGKSVKYVHIAADPATPASVTVYIDDGGGTARTVAYTNTDEITAGLTGPGGSALGGEEFLTLANHPVDISQEVTLVSNYRNTLTAGVDYILNPTDGRVFFIGALISGETITASYTWFTGLVQEAQKVLLGDVDDQVNYPGFSPIGVTVRVDVPEVIAIEIVATLKVASGYARDEVIAEVKDAFLTYINTLGISGDVVRNDLVQIAMDVPGVIDIVLVQPSENVIVYDNELPRSTSNDLDIT